MILLIFDDSSDFFQISRKHINNQLGDIRVTGKIESNVSSLHDVFLSNYCLSHRHRDLFLKNLPYYLPVHSCSLIIAFVKGS